MEKIIITIPDNLSPQEELLIIAKNLNKKLLPSAKNNKILGNIKSLTWKQRKFTKHD